MGKINYKWPVAALALMLNALMIFQNCGEFKGMHSGLSSLSGPDPGPPTLELKTEKHSCFDFGTNDSRQYHLRNRRDVPDVQV